MQFPWERTEKIREAKEMLGSDPVGAVEKIALTVISSALHCCTTADRALLQQLHKDMKHSEKKQYEDHPIPIANWCETVLWINAVISC